MKKITVNVRRHSISDKSTGRKDYPISKEGSELAEKEGKKIIVPEGGIQLYASPKLRAIQTANFIHHGACLTYKKMLEERGYCSYYAGEVAVKFFRNRIKKNDLLDSMAGYITKISDVKKLFDSMPLDDGVNLILNDDPEAVERAGREIREFIDYAASKSEDGSLVEGITHGAKLESGLISLLGIPVKDIAELGGAARECDHFSLELSVEESGVYKVEKALYKGQEFKVK